MPLCENRLRFHSGCACQIRPLSPRSSAAPCVGALFALFAPLCRTFVGPIAAISALVLPHPRITAGVSPQGANRRTICRSRKHSQRSPPRHPGLAVEPPGVFRTRIGRSETRLCGKRLRNLFVAMRAGYRPLALSSGRGIESVEFGPLD